MIDDFRGSGAPKMPEPIRLDTISDQPTTENTPNPTFKTPEEIANETESVDVIDMADDPSTRGQKDANEPSSRWSKFAWGNLTKKQQIIAVVGGVVALLCIGGGVYALTMQKSAPKPVTVKAVVVKPTPVTAKPIVSPLTGMPVTTDQQKQPVTGVMIENSPDARPQSGLKDAGVVFEAIAEGGITRFLALYQEETPGNIGPVRSSRPYYLQWALGFDAAYAHVGGSPDALADIKSWGVKDLDQFYNSGAYHRISTRYAPHNMYTSRASLLALQNSKGYSTSTYTPLVRKAETPSKAPNPTSVDFAISGFYYNVHYDYDAVTNSYKRNEAGAPHMDADSNTQLEPKVVVALVMPYSLMADGYHSSYNSIGTGKAYVFQDGVLTTGTWSKTDMKSQFTFTDDTGKPLALDAGQTWISAVGAATDVTYK